MSTLTSRERVLRTLRHGEPDRVPVNYKANPGIDRRLKEHFGLAPGDHEGLCRALGVDFRAVWVPYKGPRLHPAATEPGRQVSADWGFHTRYIEHGSGGYWEPWGEPLRDIDLAAALAYPMPSPDDYDYFLVRAQCEQYRDYGVSIHAGFEVMNWTGQFFGHERMWQT
ncbi:MAG: hypothetical protein M1457_07810, partial [bacterium]|nr:hypothetical protein [bacterium]